MKKLAAILSVVALVLCLGVVLSARNQDKKDKKDFQTSGPGGFGMEGQGMMMGIPERLQKKLGLTDEQVKKIEAALLDTMKQTIKLEADARIAQIEVMEVLKSDKPDVKNLDAKIDAAAKIMANVFKTRLHAWLEIKKTLTAEQADALESMFLGMGPGMGMGGQRQGMRGQDRPGGQRGQRGGGMMGGDRPGGGQRGQMGGGMMGPGPMMGQPPAEGNPPETNE